MAVDKLNVSIGDKVDIVIKSNVGKRQFLSKIINIVNSSIIDLMIPEELEMSKFVVKDAVFDIAIPKGEAIFEFSVMVLGKFYDNIAILRVQIHSEIKKIQRRDFFRLEIVKEFKGREVEEIKSCKFGEVFSGNIRDLSGGGVLLQTNKELDIDNIIEISFKISDGHELVLFGVILRKIIVNVPKYNFEYGIKFINITEYERNTLMKYIFEEQRKLIKKGWFK